MDVIRVISFLERRGPNGMSLSLKVGDETSTLELAKLTGFLWRGTRFLGTGVNRRFYPFTRRVIGHTGFVKELDR